MSKPIATIITLDDFAAHETLDGKTFQIHVVGPKQLRLYPMEISAAPARCPVVIQGEQCGKQAGHDGKHQWANGD